MDDYLQQIQIRSDEHVDQHKVGGVSIVSGLVTKGGNPRMIEGSAKIQHLSVPLGLVLFPVSEDTCQHIHQNQEVNVLEDRLFDHMYFSTVVDKASTRRRRTKKQHGERSHRSSHKNE